MYTEQIQKLSIDLAMKVCYNKLRKDDQNSDDVETQRIPNASHAQECDTIG